MQAIYAQNQAGQRVVAPNSFFLDTGDKRSPEWQLGVVWYDFAKLSPTDQQFRKINGNKDTPGPWYSGNFARPSANHPGGVQATMGDSRVIFISDSTEYHVYFAIMTPKGKQAKLDPIGNLPVAARVDPNNPSSVPWTEYILNDADLGAQ